jgi:hypothetical protein
MSAKSMPSSRSPLDRLLFGAMAGHPERTPNFGIPKHRRCDRHRGSGAVTTMIGPVQPTGNCHSRDVTDSSFESAERFPNRKTRWIHRKGPCGADWRDSTSTRAVGPPAGPPSCRAAAPR